MFTDIKLIKTNHFADGNVSPKFHLVAERYGEAVFFGTGPTVTDALKEFTDQATKYDAYHQNTETKLSASVAMANTA